RQRRPPGELPLTLFVRSRMYRLSESSAMQKPSASKQQHQRDEHERSGATNLKPHIEGRKVEHGRSPPSRPNQVSLVRLIVRGGRIEDAPFPNPGKTLSEVGVWIRTSKLRCTHTKHLV